MTARSLMFMGTGSDVGKSLLVAGLCRAYANRGLRVAPFKPQNMSNNAAVTADGGEIGRAHALQARAARRYPVTAMNPVLLKPEHETGAQLVVRGERVGSFPARDYWKKRGELLPDVLAAHAELAADADLILVEGAGSASEVNLRHNDIANFGFARAAAIPVVLAGDIQRGGVIAALTGTFAVVDPADAALIVATLVNKFQGDPVLFADGRAFIAQRTGVPCLGPVPFFADARNLPAEDVLALDAHPQTGEGPFRIVVPRLPRIANFDDLDPLRLEPGVSLEIVEPGRPLPFADLIIIPGSKATRADLRALRAEGWDIDIIAHHRAGARVLGICGGYQMLGRSVWDPGLEGPSGFSAGLGLLDVETALGPTKQLRVETARSALTGDPVAGYHMHMGVTQGPDTSRPFAHVGEAPEGAVSGDGRAMGTYLHGLFATDAFRRSFLGSAAAGAPQLAYEAIVEQTLDALADHLARHLDLDALLEMSPLVFAFVAPLALIIERLWGYPQSLFSIIGHPVIWMGWLIEWLDKRLNLGANRRGRGVLALVLLLAATAAVTIPLAWFCRGLPFGFLFEALLASSLLAQKSLADAVRAVAEGLRNSLAEGRAMVGHIVGRDPDTLDEPGVARAAIESLAESTSDGVVAPLFWLLIGGLPGIALYKMVNTADSMIGHRTERHEEFGWAAARLDDLLNLVPARLTALLFAGAARAVQGAQPQQAWSTALRDASKHESPNAGWPEAALAGALGFSLGGPRSYDGELVDLPHFGEGRADLGPDDIERALQLYSAALNIVLVASVVIAVALLRLG